MEKSRQEILELQEKLVAMLPEVQEELRRKYPNVVSAEVGLKRKGRNVTDLICFRVIVKQKKDERDLAPEELIPKSIRGIPTDVLVEEINFPHEDTSGYDLLTGGIQITGSGGIGTLGCFVTRISEPAASKKIYALTNHHVAVGAGAVGDRVGQPNAPSGSNCCLCGDIGTVFAAEVGSPAGTATLMGPVLTAPGSLNAIDAALVRLLGQEAGDPKTVFFSNVIEGIGPVFGNITGPPVINDRVRKRGRTTSLTFGQIEALIATRTVGYDTGQVTYIDNMIIINPLAENVNMAMGGDSGSVVVNSLNQVVALLFAGPSTDVTATASPINTVASRLGISVLSTGTANSIPLSSISLEEPKPVRAASYVNAFEKKIKSIPEGHIMMEMLLDHRHEVMDLINDNREVKLAWHRFNGPEYIGHILKNSSDEKHPIPQDINGYSLQNLLIKMSEVLERHGSRKLSKAVDDYSVFAFNFAEQYSGPGSLEKLLKEFPRCPKCGKPIHFNAHAD